MTDRELLELAAKAGGYDNYEYVENEYRDGRKVTGHYDSLLEVCINPLTNDGDALRLAVKLEMLVCINTCYYVSASKEHVSVTEHIGNDGKGCIYAATRRAIVRAAAEIGKGLK